MEERVKQLIEKLEGAKNAQLFTEMTGMSMEKFVQTYPSVAQQIVAGKQVSEAFKSQGALSGTVHAQSRYVDGELTIKVSMPQADRLTLSTTEKDAKDIKRYFMGTLIPEENLKKLLEINKWRHANNVVSNGRANTNGGYMAVPRWTKGIKKDGTEGNIPVRDENGKQIVDSYLIGFAPDGSIRGHKKSFVYKLFFEPQYEPQRDEKGKIMKDAEGNTIYTENPVIKGGEIQYDINKLNGNSAVRTIYGRELTVDECKSLVVKGESIPISGCKNKEGEAFCCFVSLDPGNPKNYIANSHPVKTAVECKALGIDYFAPVKTEVKEEVKTTVKEEVKTEVKAEKTAEKKETKKTTRKTTKKSI